MVGSRTGDLSSASQSNNVCRSVSGQGYGQSGYGRQGNANVVRTVESSYHRNCILLFSVVLSGTTSRATSRGEHNRKGSDGLDVSTYWF